MRLRGEGDIEWRQGRCDRPTGRAPLVDRAAHWRGAIVGRAA